MHTIFRSLAAATLAAASIGAQAQSQVTVSNAWVRATVPAQKATGAFMQLQSVQDAKFVSASSPLTPTVEVHEMAMQGDVMRMRQVQAVDLPAGKVVELKPGGHHIMLMNLKAQVKEGDTVPLTLVFEGKDGKRQTLEVKAPVHGIGHTGKEDHSAHGKH